ncbi:MAG: hypothetical protein R2752_19450 [Vicinamibacterales bacterium]
MRAFDVRTTFIEAHFDALIAEPPAHVTAAAAAMAAAVVAHEAPAAGAAGAVTGARGAGPPATAGAPAAAVDPWDLLGPVNW